MRPVNILTEDYIQLEMACAKNEKDIRTELNSLHEQIDNVVNAYANSDKGSAAYLSLRYSPIFEELTLFKYKTALASIAKTLTEKTSIPLEKSSRYSYALYEMENSKETNDFMDSTVIFGDPKWFDIPAALNEDYSVSYTEAGKSHAIKKIADIQEKLETAFGKLKSINENEIRSSLDTLADIYTFAKEN